MITKVEVDKAGVKVRVFHAYGYVGDSKVHAKFKWTHPADKKSRSECDACVRGALPGWVKRAPR